MVKYYSSSSLIMLEIFKFNWDNKYTTRTLVAVVPIQVCAEYHHHRLNHHRNRL